MGMSRSAEKATVSVLREADRSTVAEPAKKNKVSEPVTSARQKHFRQIQVGEAGELPLWIQLAERVLDIRGAQEDQRKNEALAYSVRTGDLNRLPVVLRGKLTKALERPVVVVVVVELCRRMERHGLSHHWKYKRSGACCNGPISVRRKVLFIVLPPV
jgi:hypothetical protein